MPAEWDDRVNTVILAYPDSHTDWNYMLPEAQECFDSIINALTVEAGMNVLLIGGDSVRQRLDNIGLSNGRVRVVDLKYNDTWARDFAFITVEYEEGEVRYIDFRFNGWGLKFPADKDNMICRRLTDGDIVPSDRVIDRQDFVLEGGSIESDGQGTIMTTSRCLLSFNRNSPREKGHIEAVLRQALGANRVLLFDHGYLEGDDTDSHVDTLARFVSPDAIAYVKCSDIDDFHFNELSAMEKEIESFRTSDGKPYRLFPLPMPRAIHDEEGNRLPATYANFLITPHAVLMPVYGQPDNDAQALRQLQEAFPTHTIISIDCSALIRQHGSLHCVTMQTILPNI